MSAMDSQCLSRSLTHRYSYFNGESVSVMDILCLSQNFVSGINTFLDNFCAERRWKIRDYGENCP